MNNNLILRFPIIDDCDVAFESEKPFLFSSGFFVFVESFKS